MQLRIILGFFLFWAFQTPSAYSDTRGWFRRSCEWFIGPPRTKQHILERSVELKLIQTIDNFSKAQLAQLFKDDPHLDLATNEDIYDKVFNGNWRNMLRSIATFESLILRKLNFASLDLTDNEIEFIFREVPELKSVRSIDLSSNPRLTNRTTQMLASFFKDVIIGLRSIDFTFTKIHEDDVLYLIDQLKTLEVVSFDVLSIHGLKALRQNTNIKEIYAIRSRIGVRQLRSEFNKKSFQDATYYPSLRSITLGFPQKTFFVSQRNFEDLYDLNASSVLSRSLVFSKRWDGARPVLTAVHDADSFNVVPEKHISLQALNTTAGGARNGVALRVYGFDGGEVSVFEKDKKLRKQFVESLVDRIQNSTRSLGGSENVKLLIELIENEAQRIEKILEIIASKSLHNRHQRKKFIELIIECMPKELMVAIAGRNFTYEYLFRADSIDVYPMGISHERTVSHVFINGVGLDALVIREGLGVPHYSSATTQKSDGFWEEKYQKNRDLVIHWFSKNIQTEGFISEDNFEPASSYQERFRLLRRHEKKPDRFGRL